MLKKWKFHLEKIHKPLYRNSQFNRILAAQVSSISDYSDGVTFVFMQVCGFCDTNVLRFIDISCEHYHVFATSLGNFRSP